MPFSHIFTLEVDMIKETLGAAAVLGVTLFGAPATATAAEASTSGTQVVAHCDHWCDGYRHHHHHHGWHHGWHHGGGYIWNDVQTGGIRMFSN
jgi:hypothetical protein